MHLHADISGTIAETTLLRGSVVSGRCVDSMLVLCVISTWSIDGGWDGAVQPWTWLLQYWVEAYLPALEI